MRGPGSMPSGERKSGPDGTKEAAADVSALLRYTPEGQVPEKSFQGWRRVAGVKGGGTVLQPILTESWFFRRVFVIMEKE